MKNNYTFLFLLIVLFISCKKGTEVLPDTDPPVVVVPIDTINTATNKIRKIDSIRNLIKSNTAKYMLLSDSVWADNNGITLRVQMKNDFVTANFVVQPQLEKRIYPGALIKGNTVVDLRYEPLTGYQQIPLHIYSTSPSFNIISKKVLPSLNAADGFIKESLGAANGGQVDSFIFQNGNPFQNYSEISINTRTSWDFATLVIVKPGDNGHIKKKTGFYVNFDLTLFSVMTDPVTEEGSFFAPVVNVSSIPNNPLIVSSVTYGRKAIIAVESDADFNSIKAAFQATVNKNASSADQKILEEATITIFMNGFNQKDTESIKAAKGYEKVSLFAKTLLASGTYNKEDYGAPVEFFCNSVTDFATARYGFKFRLDYPVN